MILKKKTNMGGVAFARKKKYSYQGVDYEADVKDGDIISILDSGTAIQGQFGEQNVFKVKTRNGEKALPLNQGSQNNLIEAFGEDTEKWVDKEVKVWSIKAMVAGKMQTIVYLSHPDWKMDDDGNFEGEKLEMEPEDEIPDDIDFNN